MLEGGGLQAQPAAATPAARFVLPRPLELGQQVRRQQLARWRVAAEELGKLAPPAIRLEHGASRIEQRRRHRQRIERPAHTEQARDRPPAALLGAHLAHAAGEMDRLSRVIALRRAAKLPPFRWPSGQLAPAVPRRGDAPCSRWRAQLVASASPTAPARSTGLQVVAACVWPRSTSELSVEPFAEPGGAIRRANSQKPSPQAFEPALRALGDCAGA